MKKINIVLVYCIVTILPIFTSEKAESVDQKVLAARNEVFNVMKNFEEGKEIHEEMVLETYASLQRASKLDRGNGIVYLNFAFQILGNLETSYYINFDPQDGTEFDYTPIESFELVLAEIIEKCDTDEVVELDKMCSQLTNLLISPEQWKVLFEYILYYVNMRLSIIKKIQKLRKNYVDSVIKIVSNQRVKQFKLIASEEIDKLLKAQEKKIHFLKILKDKLSQKHLKVSSQVEEKINSKKGISSFLVGFGTSLGVYGGLSLLLRLFKNDLNRKLFLSKLFVSSLFGGGGMYVIHSHLVNKERKLNQRIV